MGVKGNINAIILCIIICATIGIFIYYNHMPYNHITMPGKAGADVQFYNYSGHKLDKTMSKLIIMLGVDLGSCDIVGELKATTTGNIGICTSTGWAIHEKN